MSLFRAYRDLLGRNGALARLLFGEFVSSIGDWLYLVAILVVVYEEGGSAVLLGIVGAARILPYVLLSVPAGIVADRWSVRGSIISGGLSCVAGVTITAMWLHDFWRYDSRTDEHALAQREARQLAGEGVDP